MVAPPAGGDQSRGHELLIVIWIFTILALIVVVAKVFTKVKILKDAALDDVLTVFSLVRTVDPCPSPSCMLKTRLKHC